MAQRYKWHANAEVLRVIDGDTFKCRVDLGWKVSIETDVRLANINAPELDTAAGMAAAAHLKQILPPGLKILILSVRLDKYGRSQAFVKMPDGSDLGAQLVRENFAAGADSSLNPKAYTGPPQLEPEKLLGTQPDD
jgi:endonuclease YncB( thermonuclease family)